MRPIGYFLLLLFCISTNMTHSMEEEQLFTQIQAQSYAQTQFSPYAVNGYFIPGNCFHLLTSATNFSSQPNNLSNSNGPYNLQPQEKRDNTHHKRLREIKEPPKSVKTAITTLLALKNSTWLNPAQELPQSITTDNPDDYKFTLNCPSCYTKFATVNYCNIKFDFKRHCQSGCPLTEEKIDQTLKKIVKPKRIHKFTMPCPFKKCTFIQKINRKKSGLRLRLLAHIDSRIHSDNPEKTKKRKLIETKESFKKYFNKFGTTDSIPNPKKRKLQHSNNC
ncbi:MAG TPA: hypothetical protein ENI08_01520 [Candidatus Dependentiae bacterium]|nr:hypothetical protein [Candidatus Dependentiae bacterium]